MKVKCWNCGSTKDNRGHQFCQRCLSNLYDDRSATEKRRRGLTDWEELKLKFYKSDKAWEDNIRSRQKVNGVATYLNNRGQRVPIPDIPHVIKSDPKWGRSK